MPADLILWRLLLECSCWWLRGFGAARRQADVAWAEFVEATHGR